MTTVLPQPRSASPLERVASPRRYLMCRPEHFEVSYAINPWMDVTAGVDRELAIRQWDTLRQTYLDLGHDVEVITPEPGLPDMVFAANGGLVIEGRALGARFTHAERRPATRGRPDPRPGARRGCTGHRARGPRRPGRRWPRRPCPAGPVRGR